MDMTPEYVMMMAVIASELYLHDGTQSPDPEKSYLLLEDGVSYLLLE